MVLDRLDRPCGLARRKEENCRKVAVKRRTKVVERIQDLCDMTTGIETGCFVNEVSE